MNSAGNKARAFHGSEYEIQDSESKDKTDTPSVTDKLVSALTSVWPANPFTTVPIPPSPDEVRRSAFYKNLYTKLINEIKNAEADCKEAEQKLIEVKESGDYLLQQVLKFSANNTLQELEFSLKILLSDLKESKKEVLRVYTLTLKDKIVEAKKTYDSHAKALQIELASFKENLKQAVSEFKKECQKKKEALEQSLIEVRLKQNLLMAAFEDIKKYERRGSYFMRQDIINQLNNALVASYAQARVAQNVSDEMETQFGVKHSKGQNDFVECFLKLKTAWRDISRYQKTADLFEIQALKKLFMHLNNVLFSTHNISKFWAANTFRFFCRGGIKVGGAYAPTGIGHIKLRLQNLDISTLSDAETKQHWLEISKEVNTRLMHGRGRYTPTATCYAALASLQTVSGKLTEDDVDRFIGDVSQLIPDVPSSARISI